MKRVKKIEGDQGANGEFGQNRRGLFLARFILPPD